MHPRVNFLVVVAGLLVCVPFVGACATPATSRAPSDAAPTVAPAPGAYDALIRAVCEARRLEPRAPIVVRDVEAAAWSEVHKDQSVRGFYSAAERVIFVREPRADETWVKADDALLTPLIVTALQHQHFAFGEKMNALRDDENRHVLEAFATGDGLLTRLVMGGQTTQEIATHVARLVSLSPETLRDEGRLDPDVLSQDPIPRDVTLLKAVRSLDLVTRLYVAGGWDLVNRAWQQPPSRYLHLLEPATYAQGAQRTPIGALPEIEGATLLEEGFIGGPVLDALIQGLPANPESSIASTWAPALVLAERGVFLRKLSSPDGTILVVLSNWATEQDAARFRSLWIDDTRGLPQQQPHALREGTRLAGIHGMRAEQAAPLLEKLLAAIGPTAAGAPPLGVLTLQPLSATAE